MEKLANGKKSLNDRDQHRDRHQSSSPEIPILCAAVFIMHIVALLKEKQTTIIR